MWYLSLTLLLCRQYWLSRYIPARVDLCSSIPLSRCLIHLLSAPKARKNVGDVLGRFKRVVSRYPYQHTTYVALLGSLTWPTMRSPTNSYIACRNSPAKSYLCFGCTLLSRLLPESFGLYSLCHYSIFANGASIARSINTSFANSVLIFFKSHRRYFNYLTWSCLRVIRFC